MRRYVDRMWICLLWQELAIHLNWSLGSFGIGNKFQIQPKFFPNIVSLQVA